ncbi:AraC family transcriptional regulator [Rhizobium sp. BK251]|uniref:AraC family transcriptional regulator n=1 Tax=Rhizobium sp. BK251 TaxID=2512125 RepID=UPI0010D2D7AB|nr:AraC family transcriptional regulator [Rhizobium sp. BK251]TCL74903.1 AraC family transcriptional regulator [Rhizobium sp. BK251]
MSASLEPANIPPVAMFSAPGHADTLWSEVNGRVDRSRQIIWPGGLAAAHKIEKASGAAGIRTRRLELQFSWNRGRADATAQCGRLLRRYENRSRYGLILPAGSEVEFNIQEKSNYRFVSIEFDMSYVLKVAELQHIQGMEVAETWEHEHPLPWHLAEAIYHECQNDGRQGLLYSESAITLLALHVVGTLSNRRSVPRFFERGGLSPAVLSRVCEYMASRLADDITLSEVAKIGGLSNGHFSFAFKRSTGIAPHAWLRRQRIDRAKTLLHDGHLSVAEIAATVGFANQSAFGVAFRRETGQTPTAWRRLHS